MTTPDFSKQDGLIPVIIQDFYSLQVRMLGYMNEQAWEKTLEEKRVTFYSRSKQRLWTKGETSGNYLKVLDYKLDCDQDSLLILVEAIGGTCHKGTLSCFGEQSNKGFIYNLEKTIKDRIESKNENSYTYKLYERGINKVAQKVGEEAVELVIESKDNNKNLFLNEAADLLYHYIILLYSKGVQIEDIEQILLSRHKK